MQREAWWRQTTGAERARVRLAQVPPHARQASQGAGREMHLSMEVVSDCGAARPSRVTSRSDLGTPRTCGPLRRDSQAGTSVGCDRHDTGSVGGERGGTTSHHGRAKSKRQASIPQSHTGGVKPLGARSLARQGWWCGRSRKTPFVRGGEPHRRTNEARVLEIEAADGRNRSYASRVKHGPRRKPVRESRTLAQASTEQPR